jgi:hypothetical protein
MSDALVTLDEAWRIRNAAAVTLGLSEDLMRRAVRSASVGQLVSLIETFAPGRSLGPEWIRSFEPLVERLWTWRDDETMAALAEAFRARGVPWAAVTNALSPDHGVYARAAVRHPAGARLAAFALV